MKFADLGLSDELLQSVATAGYDEPTAIQAQVCIDMSGAAITEISETAENVAILS